MNKLNERLSPIQRRETNRRLQTSLKRRGNIERGKGISPIALATANINRETKLKRMRPTGRAIQKQKHLAAATDNSSTWKNKIPETLLDENAQLNYILSSKEKVMSGATRAFRKGATKAKKTGVGNKGEDKILDVPRTFKGMLRRGRKARKKGQRKKFVASAKKSTLG